MHILYEMLHFGDILHTIVILPTNTGLSHRPLPIFKNYMKKWKNVFKKYIKKIFVSNLFFFFFFKCIFEDIL